MSDSSKEKSETSIEIPKFATTEEIERGKEGVDSLRAVLKKTRLNVRPFLLFGDQASYIQSVFLGLKAMTGFGYKRPQFPLPEGMIDSGKYLIDLTTAQKVIEGNSDVFKDYNPDLITVEEYMRRLTGKPSIGSEVDKKVGLLHGDPKDAVMDYARYNGANHFLVEQSISDYRMGRHTMSPFDQELLRNISGCEKNGTWTGSTGHEKERFEFIRAHEAEVRNFIRKQYMTGPEAIDYLMGTFKPTVKARGFAYFQGRGSEATLNHPKKVDEVYQHSGMNHFLKSARRFGMFMR